VDDLYGLDPLDRWLNARQGKQRAVLLWYQAFIPGWLLGMVAWFTWAFFGSASVVAVPLIAGAAAVLALPLRRLLPALHARRLRRNPARTGPEFMWRLIALTSLLATGMALAAVNQAAGPSLPGGLKGTIALLGPLESLAVLPLAFTMPRYAKRYAKARLPHWPQLPYPPLPPHQPPS